MRRTEQNHDDEDIYSDRLRKECEASIEQFKTKEDKLPKSFLIMRVLLKKKVAGVSWIIGQVVDMSTTEPRQQNLTIQIKKLKPKIRTISCGTLPPPTPRTSE